MKFIELIYVGTTFASVIMAFPQLKQLWRLKNSDEFNLSTWVAWFVAQLSSLVYAIAIKSIPYLIVNFLWLSFYVTMIALIFKYRKGSQLAYANQPQQNISRPTLL
jgi:uncharacterized protein with PQ loop repeat